MELLNLGQEQPLPPLPLPLLPVTVPAGGGGAPSAAGVAGKPTPLKTSSLSRLAELELYLRQCDDQNYIKHYIKLLSSMPRDVLEDLTAKTKARSAWLSGEEQREYKRAKLLNVMGTPCCGPFDAVGNGGGSAAAAAQDADAFCSQVLAGGSGSAGGTPRQPAAAALGCVGGGGGGSGADELAPAGAGGIQLERLEMDLQQQPFMTPADAARTRARVLPPGQAGGNSTAAAAAGQRGGLTIGGIEAAAAVTAGAAQPALAAPPGSGSGQSGSPGTASPPVAAGVTDHQIAGISPDGQSTAAAAAAAAQAHPHAVARGSGGVVRQVILPSKAA